MRVTTKMVNESAQRAGLPGLGQSLLDVMNQKDSGNSLLNTVQKTGNTKAAKAVSSLMKDGYEKVGKSADELTKNARQFIEAEQEKDGEKLRALAKDIVNSFNETLKASGKTNDTLDQYYSKMLKEAASENKNFFSEAGITIQKDGLLRIDEEKMKTADADTLIQALGSGSVFNEKAAFLGEHISDHAAASAGSVSSQYGSNGTLYSDYTSKMDWWG